MKRFFRPWLQFTLIFSILAALLPLPIHTASAASRISINSLYVTESANDIVNNRPKDDNKVPRVVTKNINITATVEGVSDAQISSLYIQLTNVASGVTQSDTGIKAQKIPNTFDVVFSNVPLTEGLNKVVVKLGGTSVVESAPGWVYYTATTNITDLKVNAKPFVETQFYPENPLQSTAVSITGKAANAAEVRASLNNGTPITGFIDQATGEFFFSGDDAGNSTSVASLKLTPGDNPLTLLSVNSTKTFQVDRNLIYDNGKPFAFDAKISQDVPETPADNPTTKVYGNPMKLLTKPTVQNPFVKIDSKLKVDLDTNGVPQYRYVEVSAGGSKFGPYDLISNALPAERAVDVYPKSIITEHSQYDFTLHGAALDGVRLFYKNKDGTVTGELSQLDEENKIRISPDKTMKIFTLPANTFTTTGSPYTLTAYKADGTTVLNVFDNITVFGKTVTTAVPRVSDGFTITNLKAKYPNNTMITVPLASAVADTTKNMRMEIVRMAGTLSSGVGFSNGSTSYQTSPDRIELNMPQDLPAGEYKARIYYNDQVISERYFKIAPADPETPVITKVTTSSIVPYNSKTYLVVSGTNFGNAPDTTIINANLGGEPLSLYDHRDSQVIFRLDDPDDLALGTHKLTFQVRHTSPAMDISATAMPSTANDVAVAASAPDYQNMTVTDATPLQLQRTAANRQITVTGTNLRNDGNNNLIARLYNSSEVLLDQPSVTVTNSSNTEGSFNFPPVATAGDYYVQFVNVTAGHERVLAQYPFTIVEPLPTAISPSSAPSTPSQKLKILGTNFGRVPGLLSVRFTSDADTNLRTTMPVTALHTGGTAVLDSPSGLAPGSYTVNLLYNGEAVGNAMKYTVTSASSATLRENGTWSKANRYMVYDFSAEIQIPTDQQQNLVFRFYNSESDQNQPNSLFTYYYWNASLPYIDHAAIDNAGASIRLMEGVENQVTELPAKFYVYTNTNADRVNYYLGEYRPSSAPTGGSNTYVIDPVTGLRKFTITIPSLPSGFNEMTFIPSRGGIENLSAKKTYQLNVSSTPYVIVSNIYNGMVIKSIGEIACSTGTGNVTQCLQGRLVNVSDPNLDPAKTRVEVLINDVSFNLSRNTDFKDSTNPDKFTFWFGPGSDHPTSGDLKEGKNVIKFLIYENGSTVPITQATFEIFKFSTNAPEFIAIKPVESGDVPKFFQSENQANPDAYATSETSVVLEGQFANATEIKLTVTKKDPVTNQLITLYDRRYGGSFNQAEPTTGNPNYFSRINTPQAGQFLTVPIALSPIGDTTFEFSITNSSNIVVVRTITITREPLPYVVISPKLSKNSAGQDQANINGNFIEIELEAENADAVFVGKNQATPRQVVDPVTRLAETHYFYEVRDLKNGKNEIEFTVVRGDEEEEGSIIVFNVNTPIEGAQYKTLLKNKISAFEKQLELSFPRGTVLRRNDPSGINQFISNERQILFGIAGSDGRVDKYKFPFANDGQIGNPNPIVNDARLMLMEPTGRFDAISPLYWIDAGTIAANETDMRKALTGSGELPYAGTQFYNRNLKDLVIPSQPGQLTLKYDPIIRNEGWKYVTVYHYDIYEDHRGVVAPRWRNVGGVVDPGKNTITVPLERFGYYQVMYMDQSYDDVIAHAWARDDLDILYSKGVMINKGTTSFMPNDAITRGEFATMLVKIFDIPLTYTENPTFTDVLRINPLANGLYDYKYIETAAKAGIVRGAGGGRFQPDGAITRQDASVMIARAANLKLESDSEKSLKSLQKEFTDANGIDVYARAAVEAVFDEEFILGKENVMLQGQKKPTYRFDPTATFTRAEAAAVAIRVMKSNKKIPK
ncbi:S-layer homology domain-containing protein [Paenibacillus sp.]|uniref:S-layer homology domain-containing protein n=1 Tax=Paenibacillus sp. TaxID=58172 RepID=UPI0028127DCC|nr:S-layer homology domain-containing protein [Paenibacillus sp.]